MGLFASFVRHVVAYFDLVNRSEPRFRPIRDRDSKEVLGTPYVQRQQWPCFRRLELPGGDFSERDLAFADFATADLEGATFEGAELLRASFLGAKCDNACFHKASAIGAQFPVAGLRSASFDGAILGQASFFRATLTDASFLNASLIDADFEHANLCGADFMDADLTGARFQHAKLDDVQLNWTQHALVAAVLAYKAEDRPKRRAYAGRILLSTDATVEDLLAEKFPGRKWAMKVLAHYASFGGNVPDVVLEAVEKQKARAEKKAARAAEVVTPSEV